MKRIIVTRMTHQATSLQELITELGHRPLFFPVLTLKKQQQTLVQHYLTQLAPEDYIVFTSQNSVEAVLGERQFPTFKAISIGPATTTALRGYGIEPVIEADSFISSGVVAAVSQVVKQTDKVWLPQSARATTDLADALSSLCRLTHTTVYTVVPAKRIPFTFEAGDCITLTSPSTVSSFLSLLTASERQLLPTFALLSIGPVTTAAIENEGLRVTYEAKPYHVSGFRAFLENNKK
ncbi:uroporphyrinogen-III synthase [Brochothrix campestris]|uniref:Uroporphyrinogen-III synthase n=1 Tax=Brochothrix campestris FSL F6-1037 TaxID=1265861 RepID=W7CFW0_9LIST|nr:uroporphyrinogen-III synthase [Brochothrix campestris]EUJ35860.1 uroporphyrinogen III synthase/methyltransferase [Brochothrix campestris FSL F6-1037]